MVVMEGAVLKGCLDVGGTVIIQHRFIFITINAFIELLFEEYPWPQSLVKVESLK